MLEFLFTYRTQIGWLLGSAAATITVIIFQVSFGFSAFVAIAVGVLAFVTMPIVWTRFLDSLQHREPRGGRRD
jgi:hypothetical protein